MADNACRMIEGLESRVLFHGINATVVDRHLFITGDAEANADTID